MEFWTKTLPSPSTTTTSWQWKPPVQQRRRPSPPRRSPNGRVRIALFLLKRRSWHCQLKLYVLRRSPCPSSREYRQTVRPWRSTWTRTQHVLGPGVPSLSRLLREWACYRWVLEQRKDSCCGETEKLSIFLRSRLLTCFPFIQCCSSKVRVSSDIHLCFGWHWDYSSLADSDNEKGAQGDGLWAWIFPEE